MTVLAIVARSAARAALPCAPIRPWLPLGASRASRTARAWATGMPVVARHPCHSKHGMIARSRGLTGLHRTAPHRTAPHRTAEARQGNTGPAARTGMAVVRG
jgi:hypothetical protein